MNKNNKKVTRQSILPEYIHAWAPVFNSVMTFSKLFGPEATIKMLETIIKERLEKQQRRLNNT